MRRAYCVHGPLLPHSWAFLASATENCTTVGSGLPRRLAVQIATMVSPSPSTVSVIHSQTGAAKQIALAVSP